MAWTGSALGPASDGAGGTAHGPLAGLQSRLLGWYATHARDLPWRRTRDPYRTLVAEVMLQQTGVQRVLGRYAPFLERFPTLEALARAPAADVIHAWGPLGYNRRAVNLQRAAQAILVQHAGSVPQDWLALRRLPGVGPYTAASILCFAFGADVAVVDTNVRRVLGRLLKGPEPIPLMEAWRLAQVAVPAGEAAAWSQALMDLGATICRADTPRCAVCPARDLCVAAPAYEAGPSGQDVDRVAEPRGEYRARPPSPYLGSTRYYRGRIIQALRESPGPLALDDLGARVRPGYTAEDESWLRALLEGLKGDGLARLRDGAVSLS